MMNDGMNKVLLLGNLGASPELRFTATGTAVLNFRLATSETFVDRNKEPQSRTDWHSVVVWGSRAQGLSKMLNKGTAVLVEGGLRTSTFEKDGQKRTKTEVHARDVHLVGRRFQGGDLDATISDRAEDTLDHGDLPPSDVRTAAATAAAAAAAARRASPPREQMDDMPY
jgi:single-strand DNA-binding protein